ncbi:MAG: hypothetical protein J5684_04610 [Eubacterium sp.]|nr:hypothetical protein [Eubacterium sp.]
MIIDELVTLLKSFKYEVDRQGNFSDSSNYPDTFITYWNPATPDHSHYDNDNYGIEWNVDIYIYSTDIDTAYSLTKQIRSLLKENGWLVPSAGFDISSDSPDHVGRGLEVKYIEYNEEEIDNG